MALRVCSRRVCSLATLAVIGALTAAHAEPQALEGHVDHGCRVEGQDLGHDEATHDGDAERPAELGARARAEGEGEGAGEPAAEEAGLRSEEE